MSYICPKGFDCTFANSCPAFTLECPEGYFCSSYSGNSFEDKIDFSYAQSKTRLSQSSVTTSNAAKYAEVGKLISVACPKGFYCPNSTTIIRCEKGHYCPEGFTKPVACDGGSVCSDGATYQLNPVNIIIAAIITIILVTLSIRLYIRQTLQEKLTRASSKVSKNEVAVINASNEASTVSQVITFRAGLDFSLKGISVSLQAFGRETEILKNVECTVPSAKLAAVMGPTACGKSTLLNAMRLGTENSNSKTYPIAGARVAGTVLVKSGIERKSGLALARCIGFVPQEEILDRNLTVKELLTFNVQARVPSLSLLEVNEVILRALNALNITAIADTVIGGGENLAANVSGGQLKRINIACELVVLMAVNQPAALLLDEPTAGLDASIANELIGTLATLAATSGITICMIVQQPRPEIFERIDHLILMQNGSIVYEGKSATAAPYFEELGFIHKVEASDADYCIDVLNNLIKNDNKSSSSSGSRNLALLWEQKKPSMALQGIQESLPSLVAIKPDFIVENPARIAIEGSTQFTPSLLNNLTPSNTFLDECKNFFHLVQLNFFRAITTRLRGIQNLAIYSFLHAMMAGALSTGFTIYIQQTYLNTLDPPLAGSLVTHCPLPLKGYCESRNQLDLGFAQLLFFMSTAIGSASSLAAVPVFGGLNPLISREASAGLSPASFAIGRMLADLIFVCWFGMLFVGVWLMFAHSGHWYAWIGVILPTTFVASSIGYCTSIVTRPVNASVIALIAVTFMCVFSGVEPQLRSVAHIPVANWPWFLSFATWTAEGTYITWSEYFTGQRRQRMLDGAAHFGYNVQGGQGRSIGILITLGIMWRILAVFLLIRKTTKR
jgi:ABC-type multidrug transport system ATPase subunit